MDFEFSEEQRSLGQSARRFLEAKCPPAAVRAVLEGDELYDKALWKGCAEMGFLAIAIPETYGGLGLGYLELCVVAEELGRVLAPTPFSSTVCLAAEFLLAAGDEAQKAKWLPRIAAGEAIGTFAFAEGAGAVTPKTIRLAAAGGRLTGSKTAVPDGEAADFAIVAARERAGAEAEGVCLFLVDLDHESVRRTALETIDPSRKHARLDFADTPAEPLAGGPGWEIIGRVFDRAAIVTAFEQIGGADRALEMARDYALTRMAFGRPIGSFQAIKHMLADMYVSTVLARSNGYYGAWALSAEAPELPEAAASARIAATQAFQHCAKNNIQVHGGMGFTWAFDCHLYYRRANLLAVGLGSLSQWENALIGRLREKNRVAA